MPTVLRWAGYPAFFYSNEGGEPPRVHVRSGDREAKIWLGEGCPGSTFGNPYPRPSRVHYTLLILRP